VMLKIINEIITLIITSIFCPSCVNCACLCIDPICEYINPQVMHP
jgi:hypothetical protein